MKFVNGHIKSQALCNHVEVTVRMDRREFVECNSPEEVARIMGLGELPGAYGSEFLTAEVEFDLAIPKAEEAETPTGSDDENSEPEDEEIERS